MNVYPLLVFKYLVPKDNKITAISLSYGFSMQLTPRVFQVVMKLSFLVLFVFIVSPEIGVARSLMFQSNLERTGVYDDIGPELTPKLVWRFDAGSAVFSTPLVYKGVVYFVSFEGRVYAINEESGSVIWEKDLGGQPSFQIAMSDEVLLVGYRFNNGDGGYLMAVDRLSGKERWRFMPDNLVGVDNPTIYKDKVLLTTISFTRPQSLFALDVNTGEKIWESSISGGSKPPLIHADALYHQDEYQSVYSLFISNGEVEWGYSPEISRGVTFNTPAVDGCCIYALIEKSGVGGIAKINRRDGSELDFFPVESFSISSISLADGVVFFGDDGERHAGSSGHMNALDIETGELIWRFETGGFVRGAASIAGDTVYFGSHDNFMYAVDRHKGEMRWRFETGAGINSTPAVVGGRLYFGSIDGYVYVLE